MSEATPAPSPAAPGSQAKPKRIRILDLIGGADLSAMTLGEIAARYGVRTDALWQCLKRAGIPYNHGRTGARGRPRLKECPYPAALDLGLSVESAALASDVDPGTIKFWRRRLGLMSGRANKLSAADIPAIAYDPSLRAVDIAKAAGVPVSHANYWRRKIKAAQVDPPASAPPENTLKPFYDAYRAKLAASRRDHIARVRNNNTAAATAAALASPKGARAPSNIHAKTWHLIDPSGVHHRITNLHHFVRTNPHLFEPEDTILRRQSSKRTGEYCRATAGIQNLRAGKQREWKGWRYLENP